VSIIIGCGVILQGFKWNHSILSIVIGLYSQINMPATAFNSDSITDSLYTNLTITQNYALYISVCFRVLFNGTSVLF
jgi:hypothetical protein